MLLPDVRPVYGEVMAYFLRSQEDFQPTLQSRHKATAGGTAFRHSDAGGCARAIAYTAAGVEESNPSTPADQFNMNLGTYAHDIFQAAQVWHFGDKVDIEVDALWSDGFDGSGHSDTLWTYDGRELGELKTMGAFAFDMAAGIDRMHRKLKEPKGPKIGALIQGALNAVALDCDSLCIICISKETVSAGVADSLGLSNLDRFYRQWTFSREQFEPWAKLEKHRVSQILDQLGEGQIAPRAALNDDMTRITPDPEASRPWWGCHPNYCRFYHQCRRDGQGLIPLESVRRSIAA